MTEMPWRNNKTFRFRARMPAPRKTAGVNQATKSWRGIVQLAAVAAMGACGRGDSAPTVVEPSYGLLSPPTPSITRIEPTPAAPGVTITIRGHNLKPTGSYLSPTVWFAGDRRTATAVSDNAVTVAVPPGRAAVDVRVETIGGKSNPIRFTYQAPRISVVTPSHGRPGEIVGIGGEGFGVKRGGVNSYLMFGQTQVFPESWDDKIIVAKAPADMGTGLTSAVFFGLAGCLGELAGEKFVELWLPGCEELVAAAIRRYQLTRNGSYLEYTVPVVVHTSVGSSNAGSFMFRLRMQSAPSAPALTSYRWDRSPVAGQPFNGSLTGRNFITGATRVFFCRAGTNTCYQHPAAGVSVTGATSLNVRAVNLGDGAWQLYVTTAGGASPRSSAFSVAAPPPLITGYTWDRTPTGTQPFNGTINGTNFVAGATRVYFCVAGSSTCYQHPGAGISVLSSTRLSVYNVRLSTGGWQVYVATSAGASARASTFQVR